MTLQSVAVTEWQGVLINEFIVTTDDTDIKMQCLGANVFYIDDWMVNGDVYHRQYWYPLTLNAGIHLITIPVRAKGNTRVQCNIKLNKEKHLTFHQVKFSPDLLDGNLFSPYLSIEATNMNSLKEATVKSIRIKKQHPKLKLSAELHHQVSFATGQVGSVFVKLAVIDQKVNKKCDKENYAYILEFETNMKVEEFPVSIRCRNSDQSFLFTFLDHDGSIQHAAAVKPLVPCILPSCPVMLTLHGTGVSAQNQADSYKRKKGKNFVFGVEKLWILAPTRHGAHNWEGPGELTSMTALKTLAELTKTTKWLSKPALPDVIVFAGHSMGGHGAWQLSVHNPDKALAVISAAGWLSKEDYGDSNLFYFHDVSISHTDPLVKSIQESCIAENQADKHASNLKGIPVMIRIGSDDRTVHPYFTRRMYRLLKEHHVNVTYHEFQGKDHWWWDTKTENDGGVTNDLQIRTFAIRAVERYEKIKNSRTCDDDDCSEDDQKTKYYKKDNNPHEGIYHFVIYNPASFYGGQGVKVLQQRLPLRRSTYDIHFTVSKVEINTMNIQCLQLYEPAVNPVRWGKKSIIIDNQPIQFEDSPSQTFCLKIKKWYPVEQTDSILSSRRFANTYGPARRIAEKAFKIVICNDDNNIETDILKNSAIYLANLFHLTSDTATNIHTWTNEESLIHSDNVNIILIGTGQCLKKTNIKEGIVVTNNSIQLGDCTFKGRNLSALYLQKYRDQQLMLVLTGQTAESIRKNIMSLATPTIPPMTRSPFSNLVPDYVVLSSDVLTKGSGSFLCSGFWNNDWKYNVALSSCICTDGY